MSTAIGYALLGIGAGAIYALLGPGDRVDLSRLRGAQPGPGRVRHDRRVPVPRAARAGELRLRDVLDRRAAGPSCRHSWSRSRRPSAGPVHRPAAPEADAARVTAGAADRHRRRAARAAVGRAASSGVPSPPFVPPLLPGRSGTWLVDHPAIGLCVATGSCGADRDTDVLWRFTASAGSRRRSRTASGARRPWASRRSSSRRRRGRSGRACGGGRDPVRADHAGVSRRGEPARDSGARGRRSSAGFSSFPATLASAACWWGWRRRRF